MNEAFSGMDTECLATYSPTRFPGAVRVSDDDWIVTTPEAKQYLCRGFPVEQVLMLAFPDCPFTSAVEKEMTILPEGTYIIRTTSGLWMVGATPFAVPSVLNSFFGSAENAEEALDNAILAWWDHIFPEALDAD